MGNSAQTTKQLVICPCGMREKRQDTTATYRGSFKTPVAAGHPAQAPQLSRYWASYGCYGSVYVACDACITEDCKAYLTHYPNGWPRNPGDQKTVDSMDYLNFEPLKL